MANRRLLVKRRKSVRNIRKITRTMQLIATARFQAALNRATSGRPYADKLSELVADLSAAAGDVDHPLMKPAEGVNRSALVVISSMRGLCGGYNAGVLRTANHFIDAQTEQNIETDITMVGKKGIGFFRFLQRPMVDELTHIGETPTFENVEPIANQLMNRFGKGEISSAHIAYMRYHSAGKQKPEVLQLLPIAKELPENAATNAQTKADYEFSPEPSALLGELLPATVRIRLFQCFTDAGVSEQIARMVAMKAATDAAGDLITALTRQYNRARQTSITMELLDIIGGVNALS